MRTLVNPIPSHPAVSIPARLCVGDVCVGQGRITSLSETGAFVTTDVRARIDDRCSIWFQLQGELVAPEAVVRWHDSRGLFVCFEDLRPWEVWLIARERLRRTFTCAVPSSQRSELPVQRGASS